MWVLILVNVAGGLQYWQDRCARIARIGCYNCWDMLHAGEGLGTIVSRSRVLIWAYVAGWCADWHCQWQDGCARISRISKISRTWHNYQVLISAKGLWGSHLRFLGLGTIIRFSSKGLGTVVGQSQVLIWANVAGWHQGTDRVASHKLVYLGRGWCEVWGMTWLEGMTGQKRVRP